MSRRSIHAPSRAARLATAALVPAAPGPMASTAPTVPAIVVASARGISCVGPEADLRFLADDALKGRRTATRGHELAARRLAARFATLGLSPADVVPMLELSARLSPDAAGRLFAGAPRTLTEAFADAESSLARPFDLPTSIRGLRVTRHSRTTSPNVATLPPVVIRASAARPSW